MKAEAEGHGEGRVKQNCALSAVTEGNGDETGRREVDGAQARKNYLEEQVERIGFHVAGARVAIMETDVPPFAAQGQKADPGEAEKNVVRLSRLSFLAASSPHATVLDIRYPMNMHAERAAQNLQWEK